MRRAILIPVLLIGLTGLTVLWVGTMWLRAQMQTSDFTADRGILQIVIGNDVLDIPSNFTRKASQRDGETADRLDLVLLWPDGSGYSEERAPLFRGKAGRSRRILITLSKREMAQDMSERLKSVYRELFDGPAQDTGAGLQLQQLREGSGYDGEVLAVSRDGNWVARCETDPDNKSATCMRDIHLGQSLTVRYRFARELLDNWREIEALVTGRITGFLNQ
ncbi:MAG: hypothetical protein ACR2PF_07455 [Rhizobiaceae bacterium]